MAGAAGTATPAGRQSRSASEKTLGGAAAVQAPERDPCADRTREQRREDHRDPRADVSLELVRREDPARERNHREQRPPAPESEPEHETAEWDQAPHTALIGRSGYERETRALARPRERTQRAGKVAREDPGTGGDRG